MGLRDDTVLRSISALVEALLRAAGLKKKRDVPAAVEAVGAGLDAIGLPLGLVTTVDAATLRGLVSDDARRALLGAALVELGALQGDAALSEKGWTLLDGVDTDALPEHVRAALPAAL